MKETAVRPLAWPLRNSPEPERNAPWYITIVRATNILSIHGYIKVTEEFVSLLLPSLR